MTSCVSRPNALPQLGRITRGYKEQQIAIEATRDEFGSKQNIMFVNFSHRCNLILSNGSWKVSIRRAILFGIAHSESALSQP
jgi:hypothetical protein